MPLLAFLRRPAAVRHDRQINDLHTNQGDRRHSPVPLPSVPVAYRPISTSDVATGVEVTTA